MTEDFFNDQVVRLKIRFGNKPFDYEFQRLVAAEVKFMSDKDFLDLVNFLIAMRPATKPPLLQDFRDGRINAEKKLLERNINGAIHVTNGEWPNGLKKVLEKDFPGCSSIKEAVELVKFKNQMKEAK